MPIKHSPPARQTRSQAVRTPTPRAPLDGTPAVPQMRAQLDRGPTMGRVEPSRKEGRGPRKFISLSGELADFQDFQGPLSKVLVKMPVSHWSEPSLFAIMKPPAFKTPSTKAPECFDGTQPFKVRSLIQSFQLFFHNDLASFTQDRKKVMYSTSFHIGRAAKLIEPYLSNLTNQDPNYFLKPWKLFESQLFTLIGDPNEIRKAEAELDF
ncbi:hypothetical protein O181_070776 [Austropuccinia psidii MF-1]|uniref:Uncharacterized protein n=1 Tax=Austropuccinia psidii MF-1 TaxID=1389203 RepID=A0A9Q3EZG7_9BASI|nr:hypothetical protein [Austropuccinia psidii MF-1]